MVSVSGGPSAVVLLCWKAEQLAAMLDMGYVQPAVAALATAFAMKAVRFIKSLLGVAAGTLMHANRRMQSTS